MLLSAMAPRYTLAKHWEIMRQLAITEAMMTTISGVRPAAPMSARWYR